VLGENVGVTLFETENCETVLLAMDYTPFDNHPHGEREAVVKLNMDGVFRVSCEREIFVGRKNGEVRELRFAIKPHESVFVKLS